MISARRLTVEFGALRLALLCMAGLLAVFATGPGEPLVLHGWAMMRSLVFPAAAPLVFFGLLFEILMSSVRLAAAQSDLRPRWQRILAAEALFALLLLAAWLPFFREVLTPVAQRY